METADNDTSTGQGRCPIVAREYGSATHPAGAEEAELILLEKCWVAKILVHGFILVLGDSVDCG